MTLLTKRLIGLAALVLSIGWAAQPSSAAVTLPPMFSDHMVLQRDVPVPVWGTAGAGEKVEVTFRGQKKSTTADPQGKWSLKLDPVTAGGADQLTIAGAGSNPIIIKDVLVGDVWVGSGQSNMAGAAQSYAVNDPVLAKNLAAGPYPKLRIISPRGQWKESSPENVKSFSAILFSFGQPLQKELDVPIGLMVGAVGGTPSGAWLSPEMFTADSACQEQVKAALAKYDPEADKKAHERQLAAWQVAADKAKAAGTKAPNKPLPLGKPGEMTNGNKHGYLYAAHIQPYLPYAIKGVLWDQGESGTAVRGVDQYALMGALIKGWRRSWGHGDFPFLYVQKPSGGGPAWNYDDATTAKADPFVAKLPSAALSGNEGANRELHIRIREYPNTFMVTASDLGPGIHPTSKSGYGARAAQVALGGVYGKKIEIYGPVYKAMSVEGDKVRVSFTHVGQGLAFKNGEKLQGFSVAGEDKKFHWAEATIDGETIVLHSSSVAKPVAVRYAWGGVHPWANLFNKDGLPAQTFRSDKW